jgi:hypothetical protein
VPFQFSQKLIDRAIKYFKDRNGVDISAETANEYLNSFARLFIDFANPKYDKGVINAGEKDAPAGLETRGASRAVLTLGVSNT